MKRNTLRNLLTSLLASFLLLSCAKADPEKPTQPEDVHVIDDPESILDNLDDKPFNPLNSPVDFNEKAYYYNDHINDVEPSFKLSVVPNPEHDGLAQLSAVNAFKANIGSALTIEDSKGNLVSLTYEEKEDNVYELVPENEVYRPGAVYTAKLFGNSMTFHRKDPKIKILYFDVKKEDTFNYKLNSSLKYFNINKVVKFAPEEFVDLDPASNEAKEWFENHTYELIYSTNEFSALNEGDNFAVCPFKSGQPTLDDKTSFYGKFVSSTKVDNGYKVVYKNADLTEVYKDENGQTSLNVYQNEKEVTEFTDVKLKFDENQFRDYIVHDPEFNRLAKACIIATGNENVTSTYDVLTNVTIAPTFAWNAPKFVFQIKVSGYIPINDDQTAVLYIEFTYQYTSTISAGGSVEVETFMGIPYWIEAKSECTETITHKTSLKFAFMRHFKPDEQDTSDMKKMVKKAYEKLQDDPAYLMPRVDDKANTSGNEKFIPLADINFPFGGCFSLFISLDIHITMDFRVMFEWNYVNEHTQRVLSFTTSDGVKNTANTDTVSCESHTIDILGELGIEIGLLLRAGLCITGLSKIFSMGFSFEGGFYIDLKGMVGVTFGSETGARFVGGVTLDIGIYGKISAFINFLCCHPTYDFAKGKLSFFGYETPYTIVGLYAPDEITITDKVYDITNSTLLTAQTFAVADMAVDVQNFFLNSEVDVMTVDGIKTVNPMTMTCDSDYLQINKNSNTIMLAEFVPPSFDTTITVSIDQSLTYFFDGVHPLTKEVIVHYRSKDAHQVSIKGLADTFVIDKGKTFKLPELEVNQTKEDKYSAKLKYDGQYNVIPDGKFVYDDTYYDFAGFTDGEKTYAPGTVLTVGDKDIVITPILKKINYHTATFYNGKGQVIKVSKVREFTDAIAPTYEEIMSGMEGYTFYGWDRSFTNLSEDVNVYGIYYKVEAN